MLDDGRLLTQLLSDFAGQALPSVGLVLDERRRLGEGGLGGVAPQGQGSHLGTGRGLFVVGSELLGGVEPGRLVDHAVGQRGVVVALLRLDDVRVRVWVAGLGPWGRQGRDAYGEGGLSAALSLPLHPELAGALDLRRERSNLDALLQDLPVLLLVFARSLRSLNCILRTTKRRRIRI